MKIISKLTNKSQVYGTKYDKSSELASIGSKKNLLLSKLSNTDKTEFGNDLNLLFVYCTKNQSRDVSNQQWMSLLFIFEWGKFFILFFKGKEK